VSLSIKFIGIKIMRVNDHELDELLSTELQR